MNTPLRAIVLAILTMGCHQLCADMEIEVKLIEAAPDISVTTDLSELHRVKGVDILSPPPQVAVKPAAKVKIDLTREFPVEGQDPMLIGIELEITAKEVSDGIKYLAKYKLTEFEGFGDAKRKTQPIFQTTTIPFSGLAQSNIPILLDANTKHEPSKKRYIYLTIKKI